MEVKKRASSKLVPCDHCGKMVHERGLISHVRLKHKLKITQVTTQVKSNSSKVVETPVKPTKLLKSGGNVTQVKPYSSNKKTVVETTQVIVRVTNYIPSDSRCDGCNKQGLSLHEQFINAGSTLLYLCVPCQRNTDLITKCSKEIFASGGTVPPVQKKISDIEKAYLANTENHKKTGIKRIPHYTQHEIEHLRKLGYKP